MRKKLKGAAVLSLLDAVWFTGQAASVQSKGQRSLLYLFGSNVQAVRIQCSFSYLKKVEHCIWSLTHISVRQEVVIM